MDLAAGGVGIVHWNIRRDARDPDLLPIGFGGFVYEGTRSQRAMVRAEQSFIPEVHGGLF